MRYGVWLLLVACSGDKGEEVAPDDDPSIGDDDDVSGDDDDDCVSSSWFVDLDGDGFGTGDPVVQCDAPEGHVAQAGDCDDGDASVNPGATEVCGGVDDDCDGFVDDEDDSLEGDLLAYQDADLDGFGGDARSACMLTAEGIETGGDCDDSDASVHPDAVDVGCDGVDSDCDPTSGPTEILVPSTVPTLQAAIDGASPGDHICVAAGTYHELLTFTGTDGIVLVGEGVEQTIIDALDQETAIVLVDLFAGAATTTLRDLTVRNGRATYYTDDAGGGLWVGEGQTAVLQDVVVESCSATDGGGIAAAFGGSVVLTDVVLRDNYADRDGGGLYHGSWNGSTTMTRVDVIDNRAEESQWSEGAGVKLADGRHEISDCTFVGNGPSGDGGGLYVGGNARVDMEHTVFTGNDAIFDGTAMVIEGRGFLDHVEVVGNGDAEDWGDWLPYGAINVSNRLEATNLIVAGNATSGVYSSNFTSDAQISLTNATITGNGNVGLSVAQDYGDTDLTVVNTIISSNGYGVDINDIELVNAAFRHTSVWGHGADSFLDEAVDPTGTDGNVQVNPRFTSFDASSDPLGWDLSLSASSELIDAGDPAILDSDGSVSDIGAFGGPEGDAW